jgi:hypothetical protein
LITAPQNERRARDRQPGLAAPDGPRIVETIGDWEKPLRLIPNSCAGSPAVRPLRYNLKAITRLIHVARLSTRERSPLTVTGPLFAALAPRRTA